MMEAGKDSFVFYRSFMEAANDLEGGDRQELIEAIIDYGLNERERQFEASHMRAIWRLVKPIMKANWQRFRNSKNGGGQPGNQNARKQPKTTKNDQENDQETAKNDQETAKNDQETAKNDRKTTENDRKTTKNDRKTTKNDQKRPKTTKNDQKRPKTTKHIYDVNVDVDVDVDEEENNKYTHTKKEKKINKQKEILEGKPQAPATKEEITAYISENSLNVNADEFTAHYEACGWRKRNGAPLSDWKAMLRYWSDTNSGDQGKRNKPGKDYDPNVGVILESNEGKELKW